VNVQRTQMILKQHFIRNRSKRVDHPNCWIKTKLNDVMTEKIYYRTTADCRNYVNIQIKTKKNVIQFGKFYDCKSFRFKSFLI
jgi:hypothetical protein